MQENHGGSFWLGILVAAFVYFLFLRNSGKYEGQNAEYWYNMYDEEAGSYEELRACVEDYYEDPDELYYNCL